MLGAQMFLKKGQGYFRLLQIKLIHKKHMDQVDPYACCGSKHITDHLNPIVDHLNPNLSLLRMT